MKEKYWVVLEAFAFVFLTLIVQLAVILTTRNHLEYDDYFPFSFVVVDLSFVLVIILAVLLWKPMLWDDFKLPKLKIVGLCLVITMCHFVVADAFNLVSFAQTIVKGELSYFEFNKHGKGPFDSVYFYIKVIVIGPLYEELLYRKIIFNKLKQYFSVRMGIGISAFLFALGHFDLNNFLTLFVFGCIWAFIYHKTGSLLLVVILHGFNNFLATFITHRPLNYLDNQFPLFAIFYLACMVGLFILLKRLGAIRGPTEAANNL